MYLTTGRLSAKCEWLPLFIARLTLAVDQATAFVRPINARLTCEVSWKCHAQSDAGIFITQFFRKNGQKDSVKFWDPWFYRVISDCVVTIRAITGNYCILFFIYSPGQIKKGCLALEWIISVSHTFKTMAGDMVSPQNRALAEITICIFYSTIKHASTPMNSNNKNQ